MNNSPVKSELYVALEMVELTQFLPFTNKANSLYQKACNLNESSGCYNLGYNYKHGLGLSKDINKAKSLYDKACRLGVKQACN